MKSNAFIDSIRDSSAVRLLADAYPSYLSYVDRDYRYCFVNRAYEVVFDVEREQIVGKLVEEVWGAEAFATLRSNLDRALEGESFTTEMAFEGDRMKCRAGCSDCCRARLSISRVEEAYFRRGAARLTDTKRRELARRARDPNREMCPALDPEGRCELYEWRPLICRSFGVPLRHRAEVVLVNPPIIDVCDLNSVDVITRVAS